MSRIKSCNVNFGSSLIVGDVDIIEQKKQEETAKIEGLALPILNKAQAQAAEIIQQATIQAQKIVEDANNEKAKIEASMEEMKQNAVENAAKEGFEKGYSDGTAQIQNEMQERLDAVDYFAKTEFEIKEKILNSTKADMLNLCLKICEKVCAISLNEAILEKIIDKVLLLLETKSAINVIISPILASKLGEGFEKKFLNVKIIQNPKIADDAIIVESMGGNVDCSISSQIEKIAGELLNVE